MALDFLSCLKGFIAIVEHKSFSQAAQRTHISTPALTQQLQRLEDLVGKKLLNRTTRRLELTEAGEVYLIGAKRILSEIAAAKTAVGCLESEPHGVITIAIPNSLNSLLFIRHIQDFLNTYPKISIHTVNEHSPSSILASDVDLVISEADIKDSQLIKETLFTLKRRIYAAPMYLKKYGIPKTIADLKKHNCLIATRISPNNEWVMGSHKKFPVTGNYSSNSGTSILCAAIAGMGLIWAADVVIREEVKSGKLIEIKLKEKPVEVKLYLYHRPVSSSSIVNLMANHLKRLTASDLFN